MLRIYSTAVDFRTNSLLWLVLLHVNQHCFELPSFIESCLHIVTFMLSSCSSEEIVSHGDKKRHANCSSGWNFGIYHWF